MKKTTWLLALPFFIAFCISFHFYIAEGHSNLFSKVKLFQGEVADTIIILDALQFRASSFEKQGSNYVVENGSVEVSYYSTRDPSFETLVSLKGDVTLINEEQNPQFKIDGSMNISLDGGSTTLFEGVKSFSIDSLIKKGVALLDGKKFGVAGVDFEFDNIIFARQSVKFQGKLQVQPLGNLEIEVDGSNYVIISESSAQLTGVEASINKSFKLGELTFEANPFSVAYTQSNNEFAFYGNGAFLIPSLDDSLHVSFGTDATSSGLIITEGDVSKVNLGLTSNLNIGDLAFRTNNLNMGYEKDVFSIIGETNMVFKSGSTTKDSISVVFKNPGLIIQNGELDSLGFSVSDSFQISKLQFQQKDLAVDYEKNGDSFRMTGDTEISFKTSSTTDYIDVLFPDTSGLLIKDGQLETLAFVVSDSFQISKLQFQQKDLAVDYEKNGDSFRMTGDTEISFKTSSTTDYIDVLFPTTSGLVIKGGELETLAFVVSDSFQISKLQFQQKDLAVDYEKNGDSFRMTGDTEISFKTSSTTDYIDVLFPDTSGLVIKGGQLETLAFVVSDSFQISKLQFQQKDLAVDYEKAKDYFHMTGDTKISFKTSGNTDYIDVNFPDTSGLVIKNGSLETLGFVVSDDFKVSELEFQQKDLSCFYEKSEDLFQMTGETKVSIDKDFVDVIFENPGLKIQHGNLIELKFSVTGNLAVSSLSFQPKALTFDYNSPKDRFEMQGEADLSIENDEFDVAFPGAGLVVQKGVVQSLDCRLTGDLTLASLKIQADSLELIYNKAEDFYQITGGISVSELWSASAYLPADKSDPADGGLTVKDGNYQLHQLVIKLSNVNLGAFDVRAFELKFSETSTETEVYCALSLSFPEGWEVDGSIDFINGVLNELSVNYKVESNGSPTIPIGDTGLFLDNIGATVNNLTQPHNLVVQGNIGVQLGDESKDLSPFYAGGSFLVDRNELKLDGDVAFGGGLAGEGEADIDLNWGEGKYSVTADWGLFDCSPCIFDFDLGFFLDNAGDVTMFGDAKVEVPHQIPLIGGKTLGSLDFYFQRREDNPDDDFAAAWTRIDLLFTHIDAGIKYSWNPKSHVELIGSSTIHGIEYDEKHIDQNHTYSWTATVPEYANHLTLHLTFPSSYYDASQIFEVTKPGGDPIAQSSFSITDNGIHLIPELSSQVATTIAVVPSGTDVNSNSIIEAGKYKMSLVTPKDLDASNFTFNAHYGIPKPKLTIESIAVNEANVTVTYEIDSVVNPTDSLSVDLFYDYNNEGYDGTLLPGGYIKSATKGKGTFTSNFAAQAPPQRPYYVYGVLHDNHQNIPIKSAYSTSTFTLHPEISGKVEDDMGDYLLGWTMYLIKDGKLIDSTLTDSAGYYGFFNVVDGDYVVELIGPDGSCFSCQDGCDKTVTYSGTNVSNLDFEVIPHSILTGYVFVDTNENGVLELGETLLSNWPVEISVGSGADTIRQKYLTNTLGQYYHCFDSTPVNTPFRYYAGEEDNWYRTTTFEEVSDKVTQTNITGANFGFLEYSKISGTVFDDKNGGGDLTPCKNDHNLLYGSVNLYEIDESSGKANLIKNQTFSGGSYSFDRLKKGTYQVKDSLTGNWISTNQIFESLSFENPTNLSESEGYDWLIIQDIDGDQINDIVLSKGFEIQWQLGKNDGSFGATETYKAFQCDSYPVEMKFTRHHIDTTVVINPTEQHQYDTTFVIDSLKQKEKLPNPKRDTIFGQSTLSHRTIVFKKDSVVIDTIRYTFDSSYVALDSIHHLDSVFNLKDSAYVYFDSLVVFKDAVSIQIVTDSIVRDSAIGITEIVLTENATYPTAIIPGNLNNDNKVDLLMTVPNPAESIYQDTIFGSTRLMFTALINESSNGMVKWSETNEACNRLSEIGNRTETAIVQNTLNLGNFNLNAGDEILIQYHTPPGLYLWERNNSGIFQNANDGASLIPFDESIAKVQYWMPAADFNNDGLEDAVFLIPSLQEDIFYLGTAINTNKEEWVKNNTYFEVASSILSPITADFNNDGYIDLAVSSNNSISVLLNNGIGGFTAIDQQLSISSSEQAFLATGDLENDGDIDLFDVKSGSLFINEGNAQFTPKSFDTGNISYKAGVFADVNEDQLLDFVGLSTDGKLYIQKNNSEFAYPKLRTVTGDSLTANLGIREQGSTLLDNALSFDGLTDYVKTDETISYETEIFTLEAWVNWGGKVFNRDQYIMYHGDSTTGYGLIIDASNSFGLSILTNGDTIPTSARLVPNEWHHVAITWDGHVWKLYLDGVNYHLVNKPHVTIPDDYLYIGVSPNGLDNFKGTIDNVGFWETAFELADIVNYECTISDEILQENICLLYYKFNQGLPNENNETVTTLTDSSSNNRGATLKNFTLNGFFSNFVFGN